MGTTLTLEHYAELRAEMESAYPYDDVLARAGLTTGEWVGAQREWLEKMGAEIERSQFELTNRYSQAFLGRQRALAQAAAKVAPPPVAPFLAPVSSGPPPVEAAPLLSVAAEPPQPESSPPRTVPQGPMDQTASAGFSPRAAALPFQPPRSLAREAAAPPAPPAPAALPERSPSLDLYATINVSTTLAASPALPFAQAPEDLEGRTIFAPNAPSAAKAALPFAPSPVAPSAAAAPDAPEPDDFGGRTVFAPTAPSATKPALPFAPSPEEPSLAATRRTSTSSGPAASGPAASGPAAHSRAAAVQSFTLEQHASLCAELGFAPARAGEILARYYITAPMKAELDQQWQARFKADPAVASRWQEAYRIYLDFLKNPTRSGR